MSPKSTMRVRALPLGQALTRRGHDVTGVLRPWDNPSDSGREWVEAGVRLVNLPLPARLPAVWYGWLAWRLLRVVDTLRPDVVHAFKPKGFSGVVAQALLARRAATGRGPRVVVDTDDWEGAGGWNDEGSYPWWQQRVFAYQERWLLRHADAVTAASRTLEEMACEARAGHHGVRYLPNGVALPEGSPEPQAVAALRARLGIPDGPVLLLYTRFVESSPERMVAWCEAIEALGIRPTVLLVGKGMWGEEQRFLSLARAQLAGPVVDAGWVQPPLLRQHFALADVALFPMDDTLINQAKCSVKLTDLLAAGVPVVAEAVGQCNEYVQHGVSGLLVPPGNTMAGAEAAAELLTQPERRAAIGGAAQAQLRRDFGWDHLATRGEEAYGA